MKCPSWKGKNQHTNLWPTNLDRETNIFVKLSPTCRKHYFLMKQSFHQIISWPKYIVETRFREHFLWKPYTHHIRNPPIYQFSSRIRAVVWWPNTWLPGPWSRKMLHHCQKKIVFLINTKELALAKKKLGCTPEKQRCPQKRDHFNRNIAFQTFGMHPRKTKMSPKRGTISTGTSSSKHLGCTPEKQRCPPKEGTISTGTSSSKHLGCTPEKQRCPLKRDHFKRKIVFQTSCFEGVFGIRYFLGATYE